MASMPADMRNLTSIFGWAAGCGYKMECWRGGRLGGTRLSQLTQHLAHSLGHRRHAPTCGMTLERDAERNRPEPAGSDIRRMMRTPPMTRHFARISARPLDMQSLDGARNLGY